MRLLRIVLTTDANTQIDQDTFEEAVSRINIAIHDFDLEIRKALSQASGDPLWAIVWSALYSLTKGEYHIRPVFTAGNDS